MRLVGTTKEHPFKYDRVVANFTYENYTNENFDKNFT